MNIIMESYLERKASEMQLAMRTGAELKSDDRMGKEYYAFYNIQSDTILEWVEVQIRKFVPEKNPNVVSIVGVTHELLGKSMFKASSDDLDLIYVHKKRLKRFIKKAVQRNLTRN